MLAAALAVMHYRTGQLEKAQDVYARAFETQVRLRYSQDQKCLPLPQQGSMLHTYPPHKTPEGRQTVRAWCRVHKSTAQAKSGIPGNAVQRRSVTVITKPQPLIYDVPNVCMYILLASTQAFMSSASYSALPCTWRLPAV